MSEWEIGQKLRHKLSGNHYFYIGPVPHRELFTIVSDNAEASAYTIDNNSVKYYEKVEDTTEVKASHVYTTPNDAKFTCKIVLTNPDTGKKAAFGWLSQGYLTSSHPAHYVETEWHRLTHSHQTSLD